MEKLTKIASCVAIGGAAGHLADMYAIGGLGLPGWIGLVIGCFVGLIVGCGIFTYQDIKVAIPAGIEHLKLTWEADKKWWQMRAIAFLGSVWVGLSVACVSFLLVYGIQVFGSPSPRANENIVKVIHNWPTHALICILLIVTVGSIGAIISTDIEARKDDRKSYVRFFLQHNAIAYCFVWPIYGLWRLLSWIICNWTLILITAIAFLFGSYKLAVFVFKFIYSKALAVLAIWILAAVVGSHAFGAPTIVIPICAVLAPLSYWLISIKWLKLAANGNHAA